MNSHVKVPEFSRENSGTPVLDFDKKKSDFQANSIYVVFLGV